MSSKVPTERSPGLFVRTFQNHWNGLLAVWIFGSAVAIGLIHSQFEPKYKTSSMIRVEPPLATLYGYGVGVASETFEMTLQTQVQLLNSPNVLTAAGTDPRVATLPRIQRAADVVQELKKFVSVSIVPGTTLIEVAMVSTDAAETAPIVNAVVDAYFKVSDEQADPLTRNQLKSLEEYLRQLHGDNDENERRWKEVLNNGQVNARPGAVNNLKVTLEQFHQVNSDILAIDLVLAELQAILATARAAADKPASDSNQRIDRMIERKLQSDPEIMALTAELMQVEIQVNGSMRPGKQPTDPAINKVRLDELKRDLRQIHVSKSQAYREELEKAGAEALFADREARDLLAKVEAFEAKKTLLKDQLAELKIVIQREGNDPIEVMLIQELRASHKRMQESVQRRLEQLRYQYRGETRVRRVNVALVPTKPLSDKRLGYSIIAPIAVFSFALCLFLVVEALAATPPRPIPTLEF